MEATTAPQQPHKISSSNRWEPAVFQQYPIGARESAIAYLIRAPLVRGALVRGPFVRAPLVKGYHVKAHQAEAHPTIPYNIGPLRSNGILRISSYPSPSKCISWPS
jgi:hypothetical protein